MSQSVQARANRSWRRGFYGMDSCTPWVFEGNSLNLYRGTCWDDYGHTLTLDCNSGHSWDDFGHTDWECFGDRDCLFMGWG